MNPTKRRGMNRVTGVVIVTLTTIFFVNLGNLALANRRALQVEADLRLGVERQLAAVEAIEAQTTRAAGDDFVEEFARDDLKWVQPGDHVVVPIPVEAPTSTPEQTDESHDSVLDRLRRFLRGS
jgi:cell division protein FtsB